MNNIFDFSSFPALTTQRLGLRQLNHEDAEDIIEIFGAPEALHFVNQPPVDTCDKSIGLIDWLNSQFQNREGIEWGIVVRGETHLIGTCGAYAWNRSDKHVDIGYYVLPLRWGRGYATEAVQAVVRWCFDNLDVHRIQADCTSGNIASERVLLKCGFRVEGIWRESCWEHGRFVDIKQFGLLRQEYQLA